MEPFAIRWVMDDHLSDIAGAGIELIRHRLGLLLPGERPANKLAKPPDRSLPTGIKR
jgi:hypothetical protein